MVVFLYFTFQNQNQNDNVNEHLTFNHYDLSWMRVSSATHHDVVGLLLIEINWLLVFFLNPSRNTLAWLAGTLFTYQYSCATLFNFIHSETFKKKVSEWTSAVGMICPFMAKHLQSLTNKIRTLHVRPDNVSVFCLLLHLTENSW